MEIPNQTTRLKRFNFPSGMFIDDPSLVVFDTLDVISEDFPELRPGKRFFADLNIYDITETMTLALQGLHRRYPDVYATVTGSPRTLRELSAAKTGVKLIAVTARPPLEFADNPEDYAKLALASGCDGVLVDFDCHVLAQTYPDREFFKLAS